MISWNSQMALDARQHLFFHETSPNRVWEVVDEEGKSFAIKLYEINQGTNAIDEGIYMESKRLEENGKEPDYNRTGPEAGTEWCLLETTIDRFLGRYEQVEEVTSN